MTTLYESEIEQIALDLLRDENGYDIRFGPELAEGAGKARAQDEAASGEIEV